MYCGLSGPWDTTFLRVSTSKKVLVYVAMALPIFEIDIA
jgi:hypothetical protein